MTTPGYATVATTYRELGWHPLPIPRGEKSSPPTGTTGRDGKDPTVDDIASWAALDACANIALRMPAGVIGIDVDDYDGKGGAATLAALVGQFGPLPATWSSTSRGPDQASRIYFLRCPVDLELPGTLGPGIEAIQRHHRYAIAAPSTRKDTGGRYRWYHPDGTKASTPPRVDELPYLPAPWVVGLSGPQRATNGQNGTPAPTAPPRGPLADDDSIAERINRDNDWHAVLTADGWSVHHQAGDDTHWTRPGKDARLGSGAVLHEPDGPFVVFTTGVAELQQSWATTNGDSWAFSMFGYLAATRFAGNRSQLAREARLVDNMHRLQATPLRLTERDPDDDTAPGIAQPYTDLGNTRRLVADHGHDLRYAPQWGTWLVWEGTRWREDITGEATRRAKAIVDGMETEMATIHDDDARKALHKWWQRSQAAARIDAMVHLSRTEPGIPVRVDEMDADPWLLNTASGALDLRAGTLTDLDRRAMVTKLAPVTVESESACPTWEWFVDWAMKGDEELVAFVQRAVGYSLTGTVGEQCLFFLHGGGANGKSTFLSVLQQLMGDYAASAEPDLLLATQGDRHPAGVADLLGRRLVVVQETDEGRRLAEATVKLLTGGDTIKARRMRENFFEFRPTHKLWMAANHRPSVRGTDHAIWRRIRMIPFTASVSPDEQDPTLLDRLIEELPGILQWALTGCRQWRTGGLKPPAAVLAATQDYRTEQDHVGRFLEECCTLAEGLTITARDLRTAYEAWCTEAGERPWSAKAMAPHLIDRGCEQQRGSNGGPRLWRGIALAGDAAEEPSRRLDGGDWARRASGERRDASLPDDDSGLF